MLSIIELKFRRFYRDLINSPIEYSIVGILIMSGLAFVYNQFDKYPNTYIISGIIIYIIYMIHSQRRDIAFCRLMMKSPQKLFIAEYMLICLPFIIFSLIFNKYQILLIYSISPIVIAFIPRFSPSIFLQRHIYLFGVKSPELVSFLRKYYWLILLLSIVSVTLCFIRVISIFILLSIVIIMSYSYTEYEPLNIILLEEVNSNRFINNKINEGFLLFVKLGLPTLILYPIFNRDTWYLVLIAPIVAYISIVMLVGAKYMSYKPNNRATSSSVILGFGLMGTIIPIFLPITIVLALLYNSSAKENLKKYLHVYNK